MRTVKCVICQKKIAKKTDNFYKVDMFLQGQKKGTDYAHVDCWKNKFNMEQNLMQTVGQLAEGAKELLQKEGVVV